MVVNPNSFVKTICSICYEDLKPIVEDLQTISICGHVFHELCLQQWFEYCSSAKKCSCPVCKQSCSGSNVARLYFQSVGDQTESTASQKEIHGEEDPELLRGEVRRLETKVSGLSSILERQGKEIKQLNEELYLCKDQLKEESMLRNDAMEQKRLIQQLLISKSKEFDSLKLDHLRLQDRNMALAKELTALKLASDLNLEEDEIIKLASFGNETNHKDTTDVLKKSLIIRNKSYKELMAKCNQLGRTEARSCKKLEKATAKLTKLKTRVQELEMVVEAKDNEVLRSLKPSKKTTREVVILNGITNNSHDLSADKFSLKDQKEQHSVSLDFLDRTGCLISVQENLNSISPIVAHSTEECSGANSNKERNEEAASELSTALHALSESDPKHESSRDVKPIIAESQAVSMSNREGKVQGLSNPTAPSTKRNHIGSDKGSTAAATDEKFTLFLDDSRQVQPVLNIKKESPSLVPLSKQGDICFSTGLLGPDGTNRYLGKWCKRGQNKGSLGAQGTNANSGELIAVGSDGRGGRIKVLRSLNQSSLDGYENSATAKRCKYGTKANNLQPQGCLQIEHFFDRVGH